MADAAGRRRQNVEGGSRIVEIGQIFDSHPISPYMTVYTESPLNMLIFQIGD